MGEGAAGEVKANSLHNSRYALIPLLFLRMEAATQARAEALCPGMRLLFRNSSGGYDPAVGWRVGSSQPVPVSRGAVRAEEGGEGRGRGLRRLRTAFASAREYHLEAGGGRHGHRGQQDRGPLGSWL